MTDLAALLDELAIAPNMPAARCAGPEGWRLFDATIEAARPGPGGAADLTASRTEALRLCGTCPELDPCRAWYDRLPRNQRPQGVCAGQINDTQARRKPKRPKPQPEEKIA